MREVLNLAGTMTALGASRAAPGVAQAVAEVLGRFVVMDELFAQAHRAIVRATGAEAGTVTSSSSAAMTLCVAAALVGDDLAAIEALPDAGARERRVAVQMPHWVSYGAPVPQAVAAAGAVPVAVGTACLVEGYHLEAAARGGLAAVLHVVSHHTTREGELPLGLVMEIAHAHGVPVIVDMASECDLTGAVALGADAVIWSGHKFLGGPTSGIVAGTRAMVRAVHLQNRGLGRLMKVGKEGIAGVVAALGAWERRDHAGEAAREGRVLARLSDALSGLPGVTLAPLPDWTGNPITRLEMRLGPPAPSAWDLAAALMAGEPAVALRDDHAEKGVLHLDPCNATEEEAGVAASMIREAILAPGPGTTWEARKRARARATIGWLA